MASNNITLNDQQQAALDDMIRFLADDSKDFYTLKGYAGVGKTTVIQFLLERIRINPPTPYFGKTVFSAPTHKAVKVLRRMASAKGLNVECTTIHSLLSLKLKKVGGKEVIERERVGRNDPMDGVTLVVIDECSMLGEQADHIDGKDYQGIWKHITWAMDTYGAKFICMGDPAQLPPVGEKASPSFSSARGAELTKVMRQRGDSPVLGVCTDLREAWASGSQRLPPIVPGGPEDGSMGVNILTGSMWMEWMPYAFSHENFDGNPDRFRIIAWRNDTVDRLNAHIHKLRYPNCQTWLAEQEPIVFAKPLLNASLVNPDPHSGTDEIIVKTEFEGTVLDCTRKTHPIYPDIPCWRVTAEVEGGDEQMFWAVDRTGKIIRDKMADQMATENRRKKMAGKGARGDWFEYWQLLGSFAEIRPAYAMTAHKSQGSTFENVFVDVMDIWANPNKSEALQCLYVACSRASHHLIVNATGAA